VTIGEKIMNILKKHWIKILIAFALFVIVSVPVGIVMANDFYVEFDMEQFVTAEYGEKYEVTLPQVKGYGTILVSKGQELEVIQNGDVDTSKLGSQPVVFYTEFMGKEYRMVQVVTVKDTKAPTIELEYVEGAFTYPGQKYKEEGFLAKDNYDGDISKKVVSEERDGYVYYSVKDSSGNKATAKREIYYDDDICPEITLEGGEEYVVTEGEPYVDPGYTALDNADGDISAKVQIEGTIDINIPGEYIFKYSVRDSYDNYIEKFRKVIVKHNVPQNNPDQPTGKIVYLTFDDGPGAYTERLLAILEKYNVKATFFVVNTGSINLIKKEAAAGHTVAIHCTRHNYKSLYTSVDGYFKDLYNMQNIIYEKTGVLTNMVRFPGGSSNRVSTVYCDGIMTQLAEEMKKRGIVYFDWNVDSKDAGGAWTKDAVVQNVINGISRRKVSVVLQHDIKKYSVEAVEEIIVWGLENGYTFLPMTPSSPKMHHRINN